MSKKSRKTKQSGRKALKTLPARPRQDERDAAPASTVKLAASEGEQTDEREGVAAEAPRESGMVPKASREPEVADVQLGGESADVQADNDLATRDTVVPEPEPLPRSEAIEEAGVALRVVASNDTEGKGDEPMAESVVPLVRRHDARELLLSASVEERCSVSAEFFRGGSGDAELPGEELDAQERELVQDSVEPPELVRRRSRFRVLIGTILLGAAALIVVGMVRANQSPSARAEGKTAGQAESYQ